MKLIPGILIILLCVFTSGITVFAQKESTIWYFGEYAGLDFTTNTPVALTDGKIFTYEGCASVCNSFGQLLFYTDGVKVYNREHEVMPKGQSLSGSSSASQSAIVIPDPGDNSRFYIFTVARQAELSGLRYSIVDMDEASGLGDIIEKNTPLYTPTTEKLSSVRHSNLADFWVISHDWGTNAFRAYLVDETGISDTVVSYTGMEHNENKKEKAMGYLKISPDGSKLAIVYKPYVELFDFDSETGVIANPVLLDPKGFAETYGLEFSPDGSKLYVSNTNYNGIPSMIVQYELDKNNPEDIPGTETLIVSDTKGRTFGAMQTAPDKKIYIACADEDSISVIGSPNSKGAACNYKAGAVSLNGRICQLGLPNFIQAHYDKLAIRSNSPVCMGNNLYLYCDTIADARYSWSGPAGFSSNEISPVIENILPSMAGNYRLVITYKNSDKRELETYVEIVNTGIDLAELKNFNYGEVCTGNVITENFPLENTLSTDVSIDSIYLLNNDFNLGSMNLPSRISAGEKLDLKLTFEPQETRGYSDSLIIVFSGGAGCRSASYINGRGISQGLYLSVPDTMADAGQKNFSIPVYASLKCFEDGRIFTTDFDISVEYDYSALLPDNPLSYIRDSNRVILLSSNSYTFDRQSQKIGEITGEVLLGRKKYNPVSISGYSFPGDSLMKIEINNGSLTIGAVCSFDLRQVELFKPASVEIYPNPASDILHFDCENTNGKVSSVSILTIEGKIMQEYSSIPESISIDSFPSGLYIVRIKSGTETFNKKLLIAY